MMTPRAPAEPNPLTAELLLPDGAGAPDELLLEGEVAEDEAPEPEPLADVELIDTLEVGAGAAVGIENLERLE